MLAPKDDQITAEEWLAVADRYGLSTREWSVLILTSQGLTRKAVAKRLRVSLGTIHHYYAGLYAKLEVKDRVSAVVKALRLVLGMRRPSR